MPPFIVLGQLANRQLNHHQSELIFRDLWALSQLVNHLPHAILTAKSCLVGDSFALQ